VVTAEPLSGRVPQRIRVGIAAPPSLRLGPQAVGECELLREQEVRTVMTVVALGAAQIQKFVFPTPVVSG
jgi:hypothetical protein